MLRILWTKATTYKPAQSINQILQAAFQILTYEKVWLKPDPMPSLL